MIMFPTSILGKARDWQNGGISIELMRRTPLSEQQKDCFMTNKEKNLSYCIKQKNLRKLQSNGTKRKKSWNKSYRIVTKSGQPRKEEKFLVQMVNTLDQQQKRMVRTRQERGAVALISLDGLILGNYMTIVILLQVDVIFKVPPEHTFITAHFLAQQFRRFQYSCDCRQQFPNSALVLLFCLVYFIKYNMSRLTQEFITSGISVGVATFATNPIDVVKVRLQLASSSGAAMPGLIPTTVDLVRSEGFMGLMKGQSAAVARAVLYGGLRLGLYTPLKQTMISEGKSSNFAVKLAAGTVSGAIAAGIANPFDLIKTRQQAQGGVTVNPMKILKEVVSKEGVLGLWKGTIPSSTRAAVLTASQCATYDEVKGLVKRVSGMEESLNMHLLCSMITGVVTTTATAPVDMVKTHMFVGGNKFASPIDCTIEIVRAEGMKGLFKGWLANYARLGPQTAIIFVVAEQLRQIAGLGTL
eukprot:TRINITY_DN3127_c0_g3_i2.p1 TRINITY_DN3127_c0_g3~~TRINITY_DN3127_c0_g3_i2.p1  ORF type:complete len:469 (-),score=30.72 TRINITY_DN3127_c0_g3_i2:490-1896(-)